MKPQIRKPIDVDKIEELSEEIHPLKAIFDQMKDHVVITDKNATIIYANPAMERRTGFKIHEVIGKNPGDLWGSRMPENFYQKMWYRIKIEKEPFIAEVENQRKDGSTYWQELRISPILDATGDIKFFIAIEPDVTSKIELNRTRENFMATFNKNIQSSFRSSRQILDWLLTHGRLNQKQQERLETVYKQEQNLSVLVDSLSDFLKKHTTD